ncbi:MAG: XRE family transcriptional regulator, partial [Phycisphaerae bacterium]
KLTETEKAYIDIKLALAHELTRVRRHHAMTQKKLAALLKTSQPRVAIMEQGDSSVSLDMLVRALLTLGTTPWGVEVGGGYDSKTPARIQKKRGNYSLTGC